MASPPQRNRLREFAESFRREGFVAPVKIFTQPECKEILHRLLNPADTGPSDWIKGWAPVSTNFCEVARHDAIVERVKSIIGKNIILWGASLIERHPGKEHPWHTDIESSAPDGRFVSVWIGLLNTDEQTSLKIVSKSHLIGKSIQQFQKENNIGRDRLSDDQINQWSKNADDTSSIVETKTHEGDALFFDGRLWHGSLNTKNTRTRYSVLLQYAPSDTPIFIPDFSNLSWPFQTLRHPRPKCILVSGSDQSAENHIVPAPSPFQRDSMPALSTRIQNFGSHLEEDKNNVWTYYPGFLGTTPELQFIECHSSVLRSECQPHPPHNHREEEVLVVLEGNPELILQDGEPGNYKRVKMKPGMFSYYPAWYEHTLESPKEGPASYLMFKWVSDDSKEYESELKPQVIDSSEGDEREIREGYSVRHLISHPTRNLNKLHCHLSILEPGAGYEPHVDAYDVGIVLLEGEVETLKQKVSAFSAIFYAAGQPHSMRNSGTTVAKYLVFEFHGRHNSLSHKVKNIPASFWPKLKRLIKDPARLKDAIKRRI
ncbi:cupin domain-containing protein [Puniceicoccaceae bacterium K14]|nr:cupin domain-containing protein [Puniceicoccaceae bacterium K14]